MSDRIFLVVFGFFFIVLVSGGILIQLTEQNSTFPVQLATPFPTDSTAVKTADETISLLFTGDIMLDRNIRLKAEQQGYQFLLGPALLELLHSVDYTISNLEGPVTNNPSVSVGSEVGSTRNFLFTFAPESTTFLRDSHITIINLGNNHILNFGAEGLAQTYKYLAESELAYFGFTGYSQPQEPTSYILEKNGYVIGFVNYNQFIVGGEEQAFKDILSLEQKVDFLVMYTHWGNEYVQENEVLQNLAHQFIDAGVDLVIGSHPHVITGHEVYKDKHIYYSLGNFIFDQYFDSEVTKGLLVETTLYPASQTVTVTEHVVSINPNGQTELVQ